MFATNVRKRERKEANTTSIEIYPHLGGYREFLVVMDKHMPCQMNNYNTRHKFDGLLDEPNIKRLSDSRSDRKKNTTHNKQNKKQTLIGETNKEM